MRGDRPHKVYPWVTVRTWGRMSLDRPPFIEYLHVCGDGDIVPSFDRRKGRWWLGIDEETVDVNFCPACGRDLNEFGKDAVNAERG